VAAAAILSLVNGIGLCLTAFILVSLSTVKFNEGGWVTLVATGAFLFAAFLVRGQYRKTHPLLARLNELVPAIESENNSPESTAASRDPSALQHQHNRLVQNLGHKTPTTGFLRYQMNLRLFGGFHPGVALTYGYEPR